MKDLLQKLGFEYMTGPLWKHKYMKIIIAVEDDDTPEVLTRKIYDIGYGECQEIIKSAIGIEP